MSSLYNILNHGGVQADFKVSDPMVNLYKPPEAEKKAEPRRSVGKKGPRAERHDPHP